MERGNLRPTEWVQDSIMKEARSKANRVRLVGSEMGKILFSLRKPHHSETGGTVLLSPTLVILKRVKKLESLCP